MITQLRMTNFKCYKKCTIKFKNFNILCGPNSSGKSSINQAILFLLQNNHGKVGELISNGEYVHYDDFEEIKNDEISSERHIIIEAIDNAQKSCCLEIKKAEDANTIECIRNLTDFHLIAEENIFYLSADRIGPEDVYDKYNGTKIGLYGENAIGYIAKNKDCVIDERFAFQTGPASNYTFLNEVNFWLKEIIGEKINASDLDRTDRTRATYSKEGKALQVRNKNTGSGLSYVVSIIAMVFSLSISNPKEAPTFIIENPEIHLHPKAQLKLMDFLYFMSKFCQIIIETHSDHIIKNVLEEKGQVIKLDNFKPIYYTKRSKKILPIMTIGEVKWTVLDMPTIDFHVSLYSYLQKKFNNSNLNRIDDEIRKTDVFNSNKQLYDTRCKRYHDNYTGAMSKYETLPTYLRNVIDHPKKIKGDEPPRKKYRNSLIDFEEALKKSIDFMIKIITEKNW